jgi:hypothetical protein
MASSSVGTPAVSSKDSLGDQERGGVGADEGVDWQTPDWARKLATAEVPDMFEALTAAIEGIRVAGLIDDKELGQLRQVCMSSSAQEVIILSAALAAQPNDRAGQQEFLGILRTIANKPIPMASSVGTGIAGGGAPLHHLG